MGIKEFAVRTGKPEKTIIAIIKGDSSITPEMAVLFESVLKIPAQFWIKRQYNYDEFKAREKRTLDVQSAKAWSRLFPYSDMVKCGWLESRSTLEERVLELFNFFGVSSSDAWEDYYLNQQLKVAFRISLSHTKEPYAVSAWLRQGEIQASQLKCKSYDDLKFRKSLQVIKTIMALQPKDFFLKLQKECLSCGVKVVYTSCIKKAPLSGATRWIGSNPVIQLTGRYKQNDRFWFTFFHEAGHILLHGKKDIFLEDIDYSDADMKKENDADEFAMEWTFSKDQEQEVLKEMPLTSRKIITFAKKFNTHPAMIVGRFQNQKLIPYSVGREFFVKLDFSSYTFHSRL